MERVIDGFLHPDWSLFFIVFNWGSIVGSLLFGALIGMFYAWDSQQETIPLWTVGLAFVTFLTVFAELSREQGAEAGLARGILWTITCAVIPVFKRVRRRAELERARFRVRRLKKGQESNDG